MAFERYGIRAMRCLGSLALALMCSAAHSQSVTNAPPMLTAWGAKVTSANAWRDYPRPQLVRENWTNLNGDWNYEITSNAVKGAVSVAKGRIRVPFAFESCLSGVRRLIAPHEKMVYSRTFVAHPVRGMRTILNFEAVDWRAQVFVNGMEATDVPHEGGNLPFSVDVTPFVREGANELRVVAWDPTWTFIASGGKQNESSGGCFYTRVSGIWQTVWMEEIPECHVRSYRVTTDIDTGEVRFSFVVSQADPKEPISVEVLGEDGKSVIVKARSPVGEDLVLRMPKGYRLWSPDSPTLYSFRARFGHDAFAGYLGMRKIDRARDAKGAWRFRLNGKFIFPLGTLDQGWWPDGLLTPPSLDACANDIQTLKRLGFNMLRKHIKIEPRAYYRLCDELGILVFQDAPSPAGIGNILDATKSLQRYGMFRREWKEEIDLLANHPSIVMWIPYNESWGQPDADYTADTLKWTKRYDPTRLVGGPSGWNDYEGGEMFCPNPWKIVRDAWRSDEESDNPSADTVDQHNYPGPGQCRNRKNRISLLGEFGGLGLQIPGHVWNPNGSWGYADTGKVANREESQRQYLRLIDGLLPLIADGLGGAVYTQTSDVELEINGLMTYDRKVVKYDVQALKAAHERVLKAAAAADK